MTANTSSQHLVFVAGEASGDMHAAHLAAELKKLNPALTFSGVGGPRMREAGVELTDDLTPLALIGFWEVLKHYGDIRKVFNRIRDHILKIRPAAVVLVDYPGFNLRLARALKHHGVKIIYYISPQVWAWKAGRVRQIKTDTDRMLVLFDFEKTWYRERGLEVDHVGHPLIDMVNPSRPRAEVLAGLGLDPAKTTIGILPGSRQREIEKILPPMLAAARVLRARHPGWQCVVLKAAGLTREQLERHFTREDAAVRITEDPLYEIRNACDAAMVASGTATLETAILGKPMVVVYKTSPLTYGLAKRLIKIPCIGLVNVVAGRVIVPECIQHEATGERIAGHIETLITNPDRRAQTIAALREVKTSLGQSGASKRAAEAVLRQI